MTQLVIPFLSALLLTVIFTPFTIKLAKKYDLVDDPNKRPHPAHQHQKIIPRAGGVPIYLGILISVLLFIPLDKHIYGILIGGLILIITGLLDDRLKNFSPYPRLALQVIAASTVVTSGVGITFITNPIGGILKLDQFIYPVNFFGSHNIILLADIFAFLWIVWMMNMVNWAKGVDGQMPGIMSVVAITTSLLSYRLYTQGDPNQLPIAVLAIITAGAAVGGLIFNWYPAKILQGFSGSSLLGFMIATLAILSGAKLATALLVLLIPSIDFLYTFFRRILSGKSPFYGDQKHLHHLLLKRGWSHQKVSLFYIFTCVILGAVSTQLNSQGKLFTVLIVSVIVLGAILWLHLFYKQTEK